MRVKFHDTLVLQGRLVSWRWSEFSVSTLLERFYFTGTNIQIVPYEIQMTRNNHCQFVFAEEEYFMHISNDASEV